MIYVGKNGGSKLFYIKARLKMDLLRVYEGIQ